MKMRQEVYFIPSHIHPYISHTCALPNPQTHQIDELVVSHKDLGKAAANDIEAEHRRGEDEEQEGAIIALCVGERGACIG